MAYNYKIQFVLFPKITFIILVLFSFNSFSQKATLNNWTKGTFNGKVKSITNYDYEAINRFGIIEKGSKMDPYCEKWKYNEKGYIVEVMTYYTDSIYKRCYKYNDKDKVIEINEYNSDGSLSTKEIIKYNDKGDMIADNTYNSDGSLKFKNFKREEDNGVIIEFYYSWNVLSYTYKYDAMGNIIEENRFNYEGISTSKSTYKYDTKGNKIEGIYYLWGKLYSKSTCKFDANGYKIENTYYSYNNFKPGINSQVTKYKNNVKGNVIEEFKYDEYGKLKAKYTYKYDISDNEIEKKYFDSKNILEYKSTQKYGANGILLEYEIIDYKNISMSQKTTYKYDANGNQISWKKFDSNGIVTYNEYSEYVYDKKGNWIKLTEFRDDVAISITEREFEYYE